MSFKLIMTLRAGSMKRASDCLSVCPSVRPSVRPYVCLSRHLTAVAAYGGEFAAQRRARNRYRLTAVLKR